MIGKRGRGRPAFRDQFSLAKIVEQVLNYHPSGANRSRSETTNYSTIDELHRLTVLNLRQYFADFGLPVPKNLPGPRVIRSWKGSESKLCGCQILQKRHPVSNRAT